MRPAAVLLALALAACRAGQRDPDPELPAVIVDPTAASRAALSQAVRTALGVPVLLAADALTRDCLLVIERAPHADPSGLPAQGRELGMPERFHLVKSGGRCVLVHERTGTRYPLAATSCVPAARATRRAP